MNEVEKALYNTRKTVLEVCAELGYNNISEVEIGLKCCNDCGIWLRQMITDLDGNHICNYCYETYGP